MKRRDDGIDSIQEQQEQINALRTTNDALNAPLENARLEAVEKASRGD